MGRKVPLALMRLFIAEAPRQRDLIREEHALAGEPDATWGGLDRVAQMEIKVQEIDQSRLLIQDHLQAGRRAEALQQTSETAPGWWMK